VRRGDKEHLVLKVPRLRSNAFCGVRLHPGAAHECRFVLQPSKGMVAGLHTVEIRQFDDGLQVGGGHLGPAAEALVNPTNQVTIRGVAGDVG
jgi:hypothetical protein